MALQACHVPRVALLGATIVLASGCALIDGFGDLEPGAGGAGSSTSGTSAPDASASASTGDGAGGGDAIASSASSVGPGGGGDGGAGAGGGGAGGAGGAPPIRGETRASYAFGTDGDADCLTAVTDVVRIAGGALVAGQTLATSSCSVLKDGELVSDLDFSKFPEGGGVVDWIAVIDDAGIARHFDLVGESAVAELGEIGLPDGVLVPIRLYRLGPQKVGITRTQYPSGGVRAELRVHAFNTTTYDRTDIGGVVVGSASEGNIFGTDMHEEAGIVTVVGTIRATMGASTRRANGDSGPVGLTNTPDQSGLRVRFDPGGNTVAGIATDPGRVIWSEVERTAGSFRVGESGPFAVESASGACSFTNGSKEQFVYLTPSDYDACTTQVEELDAADLDLWNIQLAKADGISAVTVHDGSSWRFGTGEPDASTLTNQMFGITGAMLVSRTRAHGARVAVSGFFSGELSLPDIAPRDVVDGNDGFVLVYDGEEPGHFLPIGGMGEDAAGAADLDDEVVVVGGQYDEATPDLGLPGYTTSKAGYVVMIEDPR